VPRFKAIELDRVSRQRTGREFAFETSSRDAAIDALLAELGISRDTVLIDPTRTLLDVADSRWTLVAAREPEAPVPPSLRRAGAKHKRVR
jgi:hypothetical protein